MASTLQLMQEQGQNIEPLLNSGVIKQSKELTYLLIIEPPQNEQ